MFYIYLLEWRILSDKSTKKKITQIDLNLTKHVQSAT